MTGPIDRLLNRPVVIHRVNVASEYDEYGNEVPGVVEEIPALGYLEQIDAQERVVDSQVYTGDWFLALASGTPLDAWDRIEVPDLQVTAPDGVTRAALFEVVGTPDRPHRPRTDVEAHVEATLRTVTA